MYVLVEIAKVKALFGIFIKCGELQTANYWITQVGFRNRYSIELFSFFVTMQRDWYSTHVSVKVMIKVIINVLNISSIGMK